MQGTNIKIIIFGPIHSQRGLGVRQNVELCGMYKNIYCDKQTQVEWPRYRNGSLAHSVQDF